MTRAPAMPGMRLEEVDTSALVIELEMGARVVTVAQTARKRRR
jgi:hypothetical protein